LFYLRLGTTVPVDELLHRKVETLFYLRLGTIIIPQYIFSI